MAEVVNVEIDDAGNVTTLPEPLQKLFDARLKDAFKRGAEKVEKELVGKIPDAAERERLKLLEQENARFKEERALAEKNYEEARRLQEERLSKIAAEKDEHLKAKEAEIAKRDDRLKRMLGAEIRAAAVAAGARDESLPELQQLLGAGLALDADLEPYVVGSDGKPLEKDGKRVSIEGFVTQYLADHPHHLRRASVTPAKAAGGVSYRGGAQPTAKAEALEALRVDPSVTNIAKTLRTLRSASA